MLSQSYSFAVHSDFQIILLPSIMSFEKYIRNIYPAELECKKEN